MNAYVQLMGGKHKVVVIMPNGQRVTLQPAYSSKASAEQACKTWGLTLHDADDDIANVVRKGKVANAR